MRVSSKFLKFTYIIIFFSGLAVSYYLGWEKLEPRLANLFSDQLSTRTQLYTTTLKMLDDYGLFGSGPGSFEAIIQFELGDTLERWESWVHNDYLEFYLTFGFIGGIVMCCMLFLLMGIAALNLLLKPNKILTWFILISLFGVGLHAAGDFPLQTLSILIPVCILSGALTLSIDNR